ncbi:DNA mismatch repair protein Mlh1-like [Acropora palmata]|uniref:DNA mismatch repair protein Mlh1-like n=1 Tax=Acropora palmata TaxID=6131 RepID=UPI003DA0840C
MAAAPTIRRLDEAVVNRIAAGEVIQRPANALKEMIENSLDAKASSISVSVKSGGLKLLQIQDNGCGIRKEDMSIVCERFTTSKLMKFEDLGSIATYGFRGEALASISHVAHVTITTRTVESNCAFKASYSDGKLVPPRPGLSADPKPCAGNKGTQITVEDLFYNVSTRRKALKSPGEEFAKIADVVSKYAIHNSGVAFTLKKQGESMADVRTTNGASILDNIRAIYGAAVARELLEVSCDNQRYSFKMHGYISNANYSVKKLQFLLFINHRLVDSSALRKAIEALYEAYIPKNSHPFVYVSLEIAPNNVDVNVHPTKHEVHFLHEDSIIEAVQQSFEEKLLGANSSRTYYTQTLLPGVPVMDTSTVTSDDGGRSNAAKIYAHQMVRTDSREQTLHAFLPPKDQTTEGKSSPQQPDSEDEHQSPSMSIDEPSTSCDISGTSVDTSKTKSTETLTVIDVDGNQYDKPSDLKKPRLEEKADKETKRLNNSGIYREIRLTSVLNLRKAIDSNEHKGMKELFEDHKFVGCVTKSLALVQHSTKLYLANVTNLSKELFYQIIMFKFGNFDFLRLSEPAPIYELALLALDCEESGWTEADGPKDELANYMVNLLKGKAAMLLDYFSFEVDKEGCILTLPLLLDGFIPDLNGLPMFVLRLATEVEWDSEEGCFHTFGQECSRFYAFKPDQCHVDEDTHDIDAANPSNRSWQWKVEHVLFPAFRTGLVPPNRFSEDGTLLQIANLPDLYKVFERC